MARSTFLDLAKKRLRMPIGADLILHTHPDPEALLLDPQRLGGVVADAAARFQTPLAFPIMDLKLEKARLLAYFGVKGAAADSFHFSQPPSPAAIEAFEAALVHDAPPARVAANLGAIRHIAQHTSLMPVGMSIGPFSLATKLLSDPITPVFLAGNGDTDEPDVALLEAALRIALATVLQSVAEQVAAGAKAVFIAEPAANKVFFSPLQMEAGSEAFERYAMAPNRQVAGLLARTHTDHVFHCCGEITDPMLDSFCSLRPALLSLGSSRRLWEDAARVPKDIVLYGNLPSKQFYSDDLMPADRVAALADELEQRMAATGHPFILGTECDTLHVQGCGDTLRAKIARMILGGLKQPPERTSPQGTTFTTKAQRERSPEQRVSTP